MTLVAVRGIPGPPKKSFSPNMDQDLDSEYRRHGDTKIQYAHRYIRTPLVWLFGTPKCTRGAFAQPGWRFFWREARRRSGRWWLNRVTFRRFSPQLEGGGISWAQIKAGAGAVRQQWCASGLAISRSFSACALRSTGYCSMGISGL